MRFVGVSFLSLMLVAGWITYLVWPRTIPLSPKTLVPECELSRGSAGVTLPGSALIAEVAQFHDEVLAYLNFDYLRSAKAVQDAEVLLTCQRTGDKPVYEVVLHLENNLIISVPFLARLQVQRFIPGFQWRFTSQQELRDQQQQTKVFVAAYNLPVRQKLERLTPTQLRDFVRRFILFKSSTDPRVHKGMEPPILSLEDANRLAADVITVADFFWLPVDFFLGIGAMENNYMDVPGDLSHAVWKRRPQKGDIVLRRRRGRVLVLNYATGVWQITRETLRYAHKLYLKGGWDYSLLPERLRPPKELNLDEIDPAYLTTYAGLLFRDLLNRFQGDVAKAVGAYNGGPGNPNMHYQEGVRLVADYARKILEQAARLNGQSVADMSFLAPAR